MQYNHNGRVFARIANRTLLLETDSKGLFVAADLSKTSESRKLYEDIDTEMITKMSIGFVVAEDSYDSNTRTRTILKYKKIYDVSAVSVPANSDTEISVRSYFDGVIEVEKRESLARQAQLLLLKIKL
jgi:HK97 family phage prohead protease